MFRLCAFADEASNSLSGQIFALKRNKIELLEMRSVDGVNVSDFTDANAREYKKQLDGEGIKVWSIGSPIGKVDISVDFNNYKDKVKRVAELACLFEAKRVRAFSFYKAYNERNKVFDYMNEIAETGKDFGVKFCHENEKEIYGDNLVRVLDIMNNVTGWGYIYDPANFLQVGENPEDTIKALTDKMEYFHIKDVIKDTGEMVPAGLGDCKIDMLVDKISGDKVLTLEPHLAVFDAYKSIDNTEMKLKFKFDDNDKAFDFAVNSLNIILDKIKK